MNEPNDVWNGTAQVLAMREAMSWKGTPHANRIASRGRGIDCIRFVVAVLIAADVVEPTAVPTYPTAWGMAAAENKIGQAFLDCCNAERFDVDDWEPKFGDICVWKCGRNSNHVGIYLDGNVWHVSTNSPCGPMILASARRRIQEAIRINSRGWTNRPENLRLLAL